MSEDATKRVTKVLSFLAALYPRFELTTATIKAYTQILEDIPEELLQAAVKDLGSRSTFFPAAAEIRRAAFDMREQSLGLPSPYEAWEQVTSQYRGRPLEMHPLTERAIEMIGGLHAYGMADYSTHTSWRARFVDAYEGLVRQQRRRMDTLPQIAEYVQKQLPAGNDGSSAMKEQLQRVAAHLTAANKRVNHE